MDKETQYRLEQGREYYAKGEYDKAEPYLRKVVENEVGFADVFNMLGIIYHDSEKVALAQEYFEKALKLNPRYTEAALNLAVTYNDQGLYNEAKAIHQQATSLNINVNNDIEPYAKGKLTNMHAELGRAYAELQKLDSAIEQYRHALKLSPDFVDIRTRLGQIYRDAGQYDLAIIEFKIVKESRPGYTPALVSLGATFFAQGDKIAANKEWQAVLKKDPENRTAGMYIRMVEQMIAVEEADADGIHLEVGDVISESEKSDESNIQDELSFQFEEERTALNSVIPPQKDDDL